MLLIPFGLLVLFMVFMVAIINHKRRLEHEEDRQAHHGHGRKILYSIHRKLRRRKKHRKARH